MLELSRVFRAPLSRVFSVFSDADELSKWWGPAGFTTPALDFRPSAGERYRIEMQPPEGEAFYLEGEFREVDAPRRLSYTFEWQPPDPDDVQTIVELSFRDLGESTEVALVQGRSRPRIAARFTALAGRTVSTRSSDCCQMRQPKHR